MRNELKGTRDQKAKWHTVLFYAEECNFAVKCMATCCSFEDLFKSWVIVLYIKHSVLLSREFQSVQKKWALKKINFVEEIESLHLVYALQSVNAGHKQPEANKWHDLLIKCTHLFI